MCVKGEVGLKILVMEYTFRERCNMFFFVYFYLIKKKKKLCI